MFYFASFEVKSCERTIQIDKEPKHTSDLLYNNGGGGNMLFQEKLKELRKKANISQYDLADVLHISRSVVAKWETGLAIPNEDNLSRLCDYFHVQKEELISDLANEEMIASKNKKISKFQKLIYLLSAWLVLSIIAIGVVYCVGLKKIKTKEPSIHYSSSFSLVVNNKDTYHFIYSVIKPTNEYETETVGYVLDNIPFNRGDKIEIYENQQRLSSSFILWSSPILPEPNGGFIVQKEGYYDLMIRENDDEDNRVSLELSSKRTASLYEKVIVYDVENDQAPMEMIEVLDEDNKYGALFLHSWYLENKTLRQGDRIYFFATLKNTKEVVQIKDFTNNHIFEEVYDEELNLYYILVKETHQFNYIMLRQAGYQMVLDYEYSHENGI